MHLRASIISGLVLWASCAFAETIPGFFEVDTTTLGLYNRKQWDELIDAGNQYIDDGYDYYYLRMRMGIAHYELKNYIRAIDHFTRALHHNADDPEALSYIYYSNIQLNRRDAADRALGKLREEDVHKFRSGKMNFLDMIYLETGPLISSGKETNRHLNLDGVDDLYGEIDHLIRDSWYNGIGLVARVAPSLRLQVSYMNLFQGRTAQVMAGDSLLFDRDHSLQQHQFYLSPSMSLGKGFTVVPAFHFLSITYDQLHVQYLQETKNYAFTMDTVHQKDYLVSLCLNKDLSLVSFTLTGTYAHLNLLDHYQAEAALTYYPKGNLDFYSQTVGRYIHGREDHFLFAETAGLKLVKGLWVEASATFGEAAEFFEKNGYIVYNLPENLLFKWGMQTWYQITDQVMISLKYENLYRESYFFQYFYEENSGMYLIDYKPFTYHQHFIIGSLKWFL
ncbi:MAG: hypothetical protein PHD61_05735 [Bacteroidales bacterium]|nr:hypothetical protein [Lentimicrobiaceae bacterium]MDD5694787.1 hypothetical protein [Bacteroidales bacterium]